jgi:hypothetical protein
MSRFMELGYHQCDLDHLRSVPGANHPTPLSEQSTPIFFRLAVQYISYLCQFGDVFSQV